MLGRRRWRRPSIETTQAYPLASVLAAILFSIDNGVEPDKMSLQSHLLHNFKIIKIEYTAEKNDLLFKIVNWLKQISRDWLNSHTGTWGLVTRL